MPQTFRAVAYVPPAEAGAGFDHAVLLHDERRVRRRLLALTKGDNVLVDFPEPVTLADRSALELEDGRLVGIIASEEKLLEVRGRDGEHLMRLCWHLGNRHLKAQIEPGRVLILRDHVIRDMLEGLGATVTEVAEPFHPEAGAYAHEHPHALSQR